MASHLSLLLEGKEALDDLPPTAGREAVAIHIHERVLLLLKRDRWIVHRLHHV